jgi:hypothetical protein
MAANVLWYGVVRDYEAISYQVIPTFFTSHPDVHRDSKTYEPTEGSSAKLNPHALYHLLCAAIFISLSIISKLQK